MRRSRRASWTVLATCALLCLCAPATAKASFGVTEAEFEAGTCVVSSCTYSSPHSQFFTQAAGHPPWGVTSFEVNHRPVLLGQEPEGALKRVRVDVPSGLAANPEALPKCPVDKFEHDECPADTQVGNNELTAFVAAADVMLPPAPVYNLEQPPGLPLYFGIHVEVPLVANEHIFLEGHVDWAGDFHEYFEINNISKAIPVLKSKLNFEGRAGKGNFLTLPSECAPSDVAHIEVESWEGERSAAFTHTPVGVEGCGAVPFRPSVTVSPESAHSDQPDGATITVVAPQNEGATEINTADIRDVHLKLPEGMTLNPPAGSSLGVCTQMAVPERGTCPASSAVGSVDIETDLPPRTLAGNVYLGSPRGATITGPPFTLYLDAESPLGVSVRLQGQVTPDRKRATGNDVPARPAAPVQHAHAEAGRRSAGARREPARLRHRTHRSALHPVDRPRALAQHHAIHHRRPRGRPLPVAASASQLAQTTANAPTAGAAEAAYTFNLESSRRAAVPRRPPNGAAAGTRRR